MDARLLDFGAALAGRAIDPSQADLRLARSIHFQPARYHSLLDAARVVEREG